MRLQIYSILIYLGLWYDHHREKGNLRGKFLELRAIYKV